jgi:hypothetical protein
MSIEIVDVFKIGGLGRCANIKILSNVTVSPGDTFYLPNDNFIIISSDLTEMGNQTSKKISISLKTNVADLKTGDILVKKCSKCKHRVTFQYNSNDVCSKQCAEKILYQKLDQLDKMLESNKLQQERIVLDMAFIKDQIRQLKDQHMII